MDQRSLEEALAGLGLGAVRFEAQTGSTNDLAAAWARAGAPDLALVVANEQTAGRGRLARRWFTPPGAALAFSLVLRNQENAMRLIALGALAVCDTLTEDYGLQAEIKWPNDVLIGRRKVCGILTEAQWQGEGLVAAILGIGVNVLAQAAPPDQEGIFPATSVEAALGRPVDRLELLRAILTRLIAWRSTPNRMDLLHAWEKRLAFRGEWVQVFAGPDVTDLPQEGELLGLAPDGALLLRGRSGQLFTLHIGEVRVRPVDKSQG